MKITVAPYASYTTGLLLAGHIGLYRQQLVCLLLIEPSSELRKWYESLLTISQTRKWSRIYLAGELGEAKRVEKILSANGIDYVVEVEPYVRSSIFSFSSEYTGAAFYVLSGQADFCKRALFEAGLKVGIEDESVG